jgi:hypothetical protein
MTIETATKYRKTVTIANGASLSDEFVVAGRKLISIATPTITSATLSFTAQNRKGDDFLPVYKDDGSEYTVGSAFTTARTFLAPWLAGYYAIKIRSGTAAAPVNQGAARTFVVSAVE